MTAKRRRSVARAPSLLDVAESYLRRDGERRMLADRPLPHRAPLLPLLPLPQPPAQLAPPNPGDAARLAAAVRELRRVTELAPSSSDRRALLSGRVRAGALSTQQARSALAESEAAHRPLADRIAAAQARVAEIKSQIREARVAGADAALDLRGLKKLQNVMPELFSDDRLVLWGRRPRDGERMRPAVPAPSPTKADEREMMVSKVLDWATRSAEDS